MSAISVEEAQARALAVVRRVGPERVAVRQALGRILAEEIRAPGDVPPHDDSAMDGFAVRAAEGAAERRIVGEAAAGHPSERALGPGEAIRIMTGAPVPEGADAVVMVEHTDEVGDGTVEIQRGVSPWQHVLRIGEDIARGAPVFGRGRRLRAQDLGALTGLGITRLKVFKRPRVGLIATGDEIVPPERRPRAGQVRNVNQFSLAAMAAEADAVVTDFGVVADRADRLRKALATALARSDVVMLSGGSSVGAKDLTTDVITAFPRSRIVFHGISVAPGKPTILARALDKPVVGLPGHPVSALVIFDLFAAPLLRILGGEDPVAAFAPRAVTRARLAQNVASQPGREDYVRVRLSERDGVRVAQPLPGKSGAIFNLVSADGLVCIPAAAEGLDEGVEVEVRLFT